MSQSVKLSDGSYIDAGAVWDNTSQKTLEEIIPLKSNQLLSVRYSVTSSSTATGSDSYSWRVDFDKTGYTPLIVSVGHVNSASVICAWELRHSTYVSGYCNKANVSIFVDVLFIKDD